MLDVLQALQYQVQIGRFDFSGGRGTCDDEASVAKKTRTGKRTGATILRTFLVRSRYWTSLLPCVVIPRKILVQDSASGPKPSQWPQVRFHLAVTIGRRSTNVRAPLNTIRASTSRTIQGYFWQVSLTMVKFVTVM